MTPRLLLAAAALATAAAAQAPAPPTLVGGADVRALIARAARTIRPDQPVLAQSLLGFSPAGAVLEYRQGAAPPAVHRRNAEFFYVLQGGGTLVTGGTLVDSRPVDPENLTGSRIDGGVARKVAAGDVLVVPQDTVHGFPAVDGTLVMIAVKVPQP